MSGARPNILRLRERVREGGGCHDLTLAAAITHVSLNGQRVFDAELALQAEARAINVPAVFAVLPGQTSEMG